jgi:hypothetical protein
MAWTGTASPLTQIVNDSPAGYLVSNANVSIRDVESTLLDVVQTFSRVNARSRFVTAQFH